MILFDLSSKTNSQLFSHAIPYATMRIDRFRSAWGIAPGSNLDNWAQIFPQLKAHGYSMSIGTQILTGFITVGL
jgi:hypothetical protein